MEKTFNVDLEKLYTLLGRIASANFKIADSETFEKHVQARYRSVGAELMCVQQLISDPDFFTVIWDLYMKDEA